MLANSEMPPEAVATRKFSGKFQLRTTPDMHRKLAIEASEAGVSINRWINHRLASH